MNYSGDEIPDHGVKKARWSLQKKRAEFDPNESSVQISSQEHNRRLKRQPKSTTENLEDARDQESRGDADDVDIKSTGRN